MKKLSMLLIAVFASVLVLPSVALAHEENASSSTDPKHRAESAREEAKKNAEEKRKNAQERTEEIKSSAAEKKAKFKKDVCETKKDLLNNSSSKYRNGGKTVKARLDKSYDKVQTFYESSGLDLENYSELVSAVELAKSEAEAALETLNGFDITVDCTSETAAGQADALRQAATEARESLKAYRTSLKELIKAIKTSAQAHEQTESEAQE